MSYYVLNRGKPKKFVVKTPTKLELGMGPAGGSDTDPSVAAENFARNEMNSAEQPSLVMRVSWTDAEGRRQEKQLSYGETFEYVNYPHIQMYDERERQMVGVPVGQKGKEIRYRILVGQITEVQNLSDLKEIMRLWSFVDEVDGMDPATAKVLRKNVEGKDLVQLGPNGILPEYATAGELVAISQSSSQ